MVQSKKLLIITYYWPPSGGAGVQRWLKFVKYLRDFGWEPIIYTHENGEIPVIDNSLTSEIPSGIEVIKTPIKEPYNIYKKLVGQKKEEKINTGFLAEHKKPKRLQKIAVWIRGNFFIPDARKFWIKPSIKYLKKYLLSNPVNAIVSTGPPHSLHLIAMALKEESNTPWIADFRDPWTNIDFYKKLSLSKRADNKHHRLEKEVVSKADCVLAVGATLGEELNQIGARLLEVITNGWDEIVENVSKTDEKFSIVHIGTMVPSRNPIVLWKTLREMINTDTNFKSKLEIKLIGKVDFSVRIALDENNLMPYVTQIDYVNHDDVITFQQKAQVLLLVINNSPNAKGILTGKLFEYLAAKRPIFCIGPNNGDSAKIIADTNSGVVVGFDDSAGMKTTIQSFFQEYQTGALHCVSRNIEQFSRKNLTKKLVNILDSLTS